MSYMKLKISFPFLQEQMKIWSSAPMVTKYTMVQRTPGSFNCGGVLFLV